jgi:hypothetical protein
MPIFERDNQKIHFIHVPKAGGTSLREILVKSGWRDMTKGRYGSFRTWHVPYKYWKEWDEVNKCDFEFAIVRNPVTRMSSLIQMWLRSFWLEAHAEAYEAGGNYGPEMRNLLASIEIITPNASKETLAAAVESIIIPTDPEDVRALASLNKTTPSHLIDIINNNANTAMIRCAEVNIGCRLDNCSWADLLEAYMASGAFSSMESPGLSPCPMVKYVGPNTHVYRFEKYPEILSDLVDRGIADPRFVNVSKNRWKHLCHYVDNVMTCSEYPLDKFYDIYREDFETFGYDLNTNIPGSIKKKGKGEK